MRLNPRPRLSTTIPYRPPRPSRPIQRGPCGAMSGAVTVGIAWRWSAPSSCSSLALATLVGSVVYPVPINEIDFTVKLEGPSARHPFGTDDLGQDLLARILYGGRISMAVGLVAMLIAILLGMVIGALAGFFGGVFDSVLMRLTDLFLSLPQLPLLLLVVFLFRDRMRQAFGPELGDLHPDRRCDRWAAVDAAGAVSARLFSGVEGEGVCRSCPLRGRAERVADRAPHPAQCPQPGDRGGHPGRRLGDSRRIVDFLSGIGVPTGYADVGPSPVRCQRLSRSRATLGALSRV